MWTPGIWELLIVFGIVVLVFGTGKVRNIGKDLGGAISEFRNSMKNSSGEKEAEEPAAKSDAASTEEQTTGS